ncbi:unnamed protein product [Brassica napus]|uniref:(rape) hypothetical protein n=1 Tax=Brassica napus TaxID=3708 RepID=A0A816P3T4_BRANA|nr:unnamed protein product [Brassica napus]
MRPGVAAFRSSGFQGPRGMHRTPRDVRCSSSRWTLPPAEPFPGRAICTSVSLRASTRVSSGFAPLRHSSPSFGSRQACSPRTLLGRSRSVGCAPVRIQPISFLAPYGFTHPLTRTHVRLLGPCFKAGQMGSPQADALSTQMPRHAVRRVLQTTIKAAASPRA